MPRPKLNLIQICKKCGNEYLRGGECYRDICRPCYEEEKYFQNKERLKEKYKKYYYTRKKKTIENVRNWQKNNKDKVSDINGKWKEKNLDKIRYFTYKSQAKEDKKEWNLTFEEFKKFWQKPCYYCGTEIKTVGIDRVNNTKGYIKENCVSCCKYCNRAKSDMNKDEFLNHCKKIIKHQGVKNKLCLT